MSDPVIALLHSLIIGLVIYIVFKVIFKNFSKLYTLFFIFLVMIVFDPIKTIFFFSFFLSSTLFSLSKKAYSLKYKNGNSGTSIQTLE